MQNENLAWYCARTKPKHENISAVHLRKNLRLEVFNPRLQVERRTHRGMMRILEPLFPGYVFVRCVLAEHQYDIQYTSGVHSFVQFGSGIPAVHDAIIQELQACFLADEVLAVGADLLPGDEVDVDGGAFAGMRGGVLRLMPARNRVEVLLDILGRPTPVQVDLCSVLPVINSRAQPALILANPIAG